MEGGILVAISDARGSMKKGVLRQGFALKRVEMALRCPLAAELSSLVRLTSLLQARASNCNQNWASSCFLFSFAFLLSSVVVRVEHREQNAFAFVMRQLLYTARLARYYTVSL